MMPAAGLLIVLGLAAQLSPRMEALTAVVKPLLPYPSASAEGDQPADNSAASRWFVVWPTTPGETRIAVKANPLNLDVQKASAAAMEQINAAVAAAERRAQAAYDKAVEQLRKTGKGADLEAVTLDDEGVAGERIDAEQEVAIELGEAISKEIASGEPPQVAAGAVETVWTVTIAPNTYRATSGADRREHFRAAETWLYFGLPTRPTVSRKGDSPLFVVTVAPAPEAFVVILRGNEQLVRQLATDADWAKLASR